MPSRLLLFLVALASAAVVAGCLISTDDYGPCTVALDCPKLGDYRCVSANVWPQQDCAMGEKGCTCAVRFPPMISVDNDSGPPADAGPPPDAGPVPTYCGDIRKILNLSCVATCHGPQMGYANSPTYFRLDYYYTPDASVDAGADAGAPILGAFDMATKIRAQTLIQIAGTFLMPPADFPLPPPDQQRLLIGQWVDGGAPYGDDALCNPPDGGVRFATDVLPIFANHCLPCHTTQDAGYLILSSAQAYNLLVDHDATCKIGGTTVKRVKPSDAQNSLLWRKLTPDGGACGNTMPDMGTILRNGFPNEFNTIENWILQGAKNN